MRKKLREENFCGEGGGNEALEKEVKAKKGKMQ